ncbi:MAG TPA: hypothetical protein PKE69_22690 [Pyrinomonadaceae bacterium]|nr:hypothetical protein [Pyrinomonadaceae bacterium]
MSRLDGFAVSIMQNPNAVGFVVIYDNNNPIDNKFLEKYIRVYAELRKIDKNRFRVLSAKFEKGKRIDFWVSQNGFSAPNIKEETFSLVLPKAEKPILFVNDWVVIEKIDGKLTYSGECPACCINRIDLDLLADFLNANSQVNARIKIYGKSRKYTKILEKLVRDELINDHKISSNRFQISYQGKDEGIAQLPKNNTSIEIEFFSQN